MTRWIAACLVLAAASACAGQHERPLAASAEPCSDAWQRYVDSRVITGDGQGHGPDLGSEEWKSVVEFKLGIRDKAGVPPRSAEAWCKHIDRVLRDREGHDVARQGPSLSCDTAGAGSIEAMVCADEELSALDRKLAGVYAAAMKIARKERPPLLKAEQRGWIKGRDDCWKRPDTRDCVRDEYLRRTAELQARYRLAPATGPVFYFCDGNRANELVVTFFETEPPTLIAERGDTVALMFRDRAGGGDTYVGRNESFRARGDEASIVWGYGAAQMRCQKPG